MSTHSTRASTATHSPRASCAQYKKSAKFWTAVSMCQFLCAGMLRYCPFNPSQRTDPSKSRGPFGHALTLGGRRYKPRRCSAPPAISCTPHGRLTLSVFFWPKKSIWAWSDLGSGKSWLFEDSSVFRSLWRMFMRDWGGSGVCPPGFKFDLVFQTLTVPTQRLGWYGFCKREKNSLYNSEIIFSQSLTDSRQIPFFSPKFQVEPALFLMGNVAMCRVCSTGLR